MWVWCKWPLYRGGVPATIRDGNPGKAPCCGTKANKWAQWLKQRGTMRRDSSPETHWSFHYQFRAARTICCNRGCQLCDSSVLLGNKSTCNSVLCISVKMHKQVRVRNSCSFPTFLPVPPPSPTELPNHPGAGLEDERCPLMTGCNRAGGLCVCNARHSCLSSFTYPDQEACMKASKSGERSPPTTHTIIYAHMGT